MEENREELLYVRNLNFTYPMEKNPALAGIAFSLLEGDFCLLAGYSGSGKTTLLRHLKPMLAPAGEFAGELYFHGDRMDALPKRELVSEIGFVFQNPDNQIVETYVEDELSFGLENLGVPADIIKRRVAEMVTFFGIQDWFGKEIYTLSGGQKQILNLAAVMTMNPKLLLLDEPISQLDPVSAGRFLDLLRRIHKEMGVTILLSEQRPQEILSDATRFILMENGKIKYNDSPKKVCQKMIEDNAPMLLAMPASVRVYGESGGLENCPLNVAEGRRWFAKHKKRNCVERENGALQNESKENAILMQNVYFKYEKGGSEIIKDFSARIKKGKVTSIVGGNGSGKTTLLHLISGGKKSWSGKIKVEGTIGVLPQNPRFLFTEDTVRAELIGQDIEQIAEQFMLTDLLERHPLDLSGGELERLALAKIYMQNPDILLLDEPVKGLDAVFKKKFVSILQQWKKQGKTVILVSHDMEFLVVAADEFLFLFDGEAVFDGSGYEFLKDNKFYTTMASRMTDGMAEGVITSEDVIELCR